MHSFPFSHKFKYVINKSFVCKIVYWNKKYLNEMLFVHELGKTGHFLFIFFVLDTLNSKVTLAVSPLMLFQRLVWILTCCSVEQSRSATHWWDTVLGQYQKQREAATPAPACTGAGHLFGLQRRPSRSADEHLPSVAALPKAAPALPAALSASHRHQPPRSALLGTWAHPLLQHQNLFRELSPTLQAWDIEELTCVRLPFRR